MVSKKDNNIVIGIIAPTKIRAFPFGIMCKNAIATAAMYPIDFTGWWPFCSKAWNSSCMHRIATMLTNISTIYLFPSRNTMSTTANIIADDITLFIIFLQIF